MEYLREIWKDQSFLEIDLEKSWVQPGLDFRLGMESMARGMARPMASL